MLTSSDIRQRFLKFFEKRGHVIIPSASLVTPDEKGITNSTLFNTAGMQPLVPYLLGKPHEKGKRLVDVQKVLRTVDIDDIGDKTHATFFEMLGNWSLGDYFKKEAINWSYEFLTSKEEGLGLDPNRLYVTVFEGDDIAPRDEEAANVWEEIFKKNKIEGNRIFYLPADKNWWEAGENGPCGPDTEMYYDVSGKFGGKGLTHEEFLKADDVRDVVEIWNDVFMQYEKKDGKIIGKLPKPSVDTGAGLERLCMTLQGVDNIYDTDLLKPLIEIISGNDIADSLKSKRIIADHIRASVFLIGDGVLPSNTDRGYLLRRLVRRAILNSNKKKLNVGQISVLVNYIVDKYQDVYIELLNKGGMIKQVIEEENEKFSNAIENGVREFERVSKDQKIISGFDAFKLFSSYGLPIDMTIELAKEKDLDVDLKSFEEEMKKHQELSRVGAEQKFKGGLADNSEQVVRYHTATHLLHQALHDVLGDGVGQKGSNITSERLRFDFSYPQKMTSEQIKKVEAIVNEKIKAQLPVNKVIMPIVEAEKTGARHFFGEKYGDEVSIYYIGGSLDGAYSKEFCGGPHVSNTSELKGTFKISKEEAVSAGVRRIKAVLV
jgi:alanyl-tRNA synthetase